MATEPVVDDLSPRLRLPQLRSVLVVDEDDIVERLRSVRAELAASTLRVRSLAVEADRLAAVDTEAREAAVNLPDGVESVEDLHDAVESHRVALARDLDAARARAELRVAEAQREAAELLARATASIESLVLEFADRSEP